MDFYILKRVVFFVNVVCLEKKKILKNENMEFENILIYKIDNLLTSVMYFKQYSFKAL